MSPSLTSLVALQNLDTAAEAARRRLDALPGVEAALDARLTAARTTLEAAKTRLADNHRARRELEAKVAQVDSRLARFDDHKAAVKTNQEFTALLHEIATAKAEKDGIEDEILALLEASDGIAAEIRAAEEVMAEIGREADALRVDLARERQVLETDLARLTAERTREAAAVAPTLLTRYEQLLRQRKMLAVAPIEGELCTACHVRLRPSMAQQIRRNEDIVQCDSCQRILYFVPKVPA
jgi:predicted  nucleic acid-binding Zn-ribbon protein